MTNHYHFLIETPEGNLSIGMRQINGVYTQLFNKYHDRNGHLFQGRYKAILIQKDRHLLEVCRYVVLNPVRAGMVEGPGAWKWSSYLATAGKEKPHPCLTTDWVLGLFSRNRGKAETEYRPFVERGMDEKTIWTDVRGQMLLGGGRFCRCPEGSSQQATGHSGYSPESAVFNTTCIVNPAAGFDDQRPA
jgi:putative transposase